MPVDSMLVAASVVLMFVVFAAALAWGDLQTRPSNWPNSPTRNAGRSDPRRSPFSTVVRSQEALP